MGVLTHLDKIKDKKALQKCKKTMKNRFWQEVYQGAKLFYLSGLINGKVRVLCKAAAAAVCTPSNPPSPSSTRAWRSTTSRSTSPA